MEVSAYLRLKIATEFDKGAAMKPPIKILHIDPEYQVSYFILRDGSFIQSSVPRESAIALLRKEHFDLIISEPHHRAVLTPQEGLEAAEPGPGQYGFTGLRKNGCV